ncbi:MAG TPA: TPM domain-containing protein [Thermoanaerobaculia bacterium]|nr:TPM domain-containing protein [Thermoanaerobaculia bacterium]
MKQFLSRLDHERIVAAIADAEKRTSGQIRVHVTRRKPAYLEDRARRRFEELGMTRTRLRNGVLIYIAPNARRFRILGDAGIHEKCGEEFWKETAGEMEAAFRKGHFTDGIVRAVAKAGEILARHFPSEAGGVNELPDEVTED